MHDERELYLSGINEAMRKKDLAHQANKCSVKKEDIVRKITKTFGYGNPGNSAIKDKGLCTLSPHNCQICHSFKLMVYKHRHLN